MYDVPLSVIATRCHLSPRRGSLFFLKLHLLTQPFRLLALLAATVPFREDIMVLRNFNFSYYYELLYAPCVVRDISTTSSFSRRIACDKLSLSVKGAGIAVGDD